ncbi:hypothetical protein PT974_10485 [Cladobotryum mycophilum]|uniref:Uncharacterized protein n=1 Tax=Cladobotryum mycophilum TaxID=491253 RepID=A0ABR0SA02_9HYPO
MASSIPSTEARATLSAKMDDFLQSIQAIPEFNTNPAQSDKGLFYIWDFVMRTKYILSELDNIVEGKPVQHPEQIPSYKPATGAAAVKSAKSSYGDVVTRTITIHQMLDGPPFMLAMMGLGVTIPADVKDKAKKMADALPK